jgi:hypothetical protein
MRTPFLSPTARRSIRGGENLAAAKGSAFIREHDTRRARPPQSIQEDLRRGSADASVTFRPGTPPRAPVTSCEPCGTIKPCCGPALQAAIAGANACTTIKAVRFPSTSKADPEPPGFIREARFPHRAVSAPDGGIFRAIRDLIAFSIITINIQFI